MSSDAQDEADIAERYLIDNGLLDPGQPTRQAHRRHIAQTQVEFTPQERAAIRYMLRLGPPAEEKPR